MFGDPSTQSDVVDGRRAENSGGRVVHVEAADLDAELASGHGAIILSFGKYVRYRLASRVKSR
jgi:hypothetical protein